MNLTFKQINQYGNVLILILLFVGFYTLFRSVSLINAARKNFTKIMTDLYEMDDKRVTQAEEERRLFGSTCASGKREGILTRLLKHIDDKLTYSELSINHIWLNASTYLIGTILLSTLAFLGGSFVNVIFGIILAILVVVVPYVMILEKVEKNYSETEAQIVMFINLVSSNASSTGSVLAVLEACIPYINDPIKGAVIRALSTYRLTGVSDETVWQLMREIEHPIFKNFIRNLDICSKNDADYRSVAKDYAAQAEQTIAAMEARRVAFKSARTSIGGMLIAGFLANFLIIKFCGYTYKQTMRSLLGTNLGLLILCVLCLIYFSIALYLVAGRRR